MINTSYPSISGAEAAWWLSWLVLSFGCSQVETSLGLEDLLPKKTVPPLGDVCWKETSVPPKVGWWLRSLRGSSWRETGERLVEYHSPASDITHCHFCSVLLVTEGSWIRCDSTQPRVRRPAGKDLWEPVWWLMTTLIKRPRMEFNQRRYTVVVRLCPW